MIRRSVLVSVMVVVAVATSSFPAHAVCHVVGFTESNYSASEANGTVTITISRQVQNTGCTGFVDYSTSNDSATQPSDYTATSGHHDFGQLESSFSFTVPIVNDSAVEGSEVFNVSFTGTNNGPSSGSAKVTIQDNDQAPPPPPPPPPRPARTSPSPAAPSPAAPVAIPRPSPSPTLSPSPSPATLAKAGDDGGFPVVGIVAIAAVLIAAGAGGWLLWIRRRPV